MSIARVVVVLALVVAFVVIAWFAFEIASILNTSMIGPLPGAHWTYVGIASHLGHSAFG
jgi:hypothetical protein